jgi:hypothetical protein
MAGEKITVTADWFSQTQQKFHGINTIGKIGNSWILPLPKRDGFSSNDALDIAPRTELIHQAAFIAVKFIVQLADGREERFVFG